MAGFKFVCVFVVVVGWLVISFQVLTSVHICHHRLFASFARLGRWAELIQCHYFLWRLRSFVHSLCFFPYAKGRFVRVIMYIYHYKIHTNAQRVDSNGMSEWERQAEREREEEYTHNSNENSSRRNRKLETIWVIWNAKNTHQTWKWVSVVLNEKL